MSWGRLGGLALRIAAVAAVGVLCWLLLRRMDLAQVLATLRRADLRLVALAVAINLIINIGARVLRWRALLEPLPRTGERPRLRELGGLLLASYALSNLLPARAGEALRTVHLRRVHGYPVGALVASQLVEKIVEALSLGLLALPTILWARPSLQLRIPLIILALLGAAGVALMFVVSMRPVAPPAEGDSSLVARARGFYFRLAEAVRLMHSPRVWARALACSWVADFADATMIGLCLIALGIPLAVANWFVIYLAINLMIAVPSTPGQIGVLEAGAVLALGVLGVPPAEGLAFAVVYHAAHVLPTTLAGLVGWQLMGRPRD